MATKGGGYVVVYITPTFSAKVWNFGTTFLNS